MVPVRAEDWFLSIILLRVEVLLAPGKALRGAYHVDSRKG